MQAVTKGYTDAYLPIVERRRKAMAYGGERERSTSSTVAVVVSSSIWSGMAAHAVWRPTCYKLAGADLIVRIHFTAATGTLGMIISQKTWPEAALVVIKVKLDCNPAPTRIR